MRILVTGSNGQLGNELHDLSDKYSSFDLIFTDENELNITSEAQIREFFEVHQPDAVINCAAYTAVDKAESEIQSAYLVNGEAVKLLSRLSAHYNSFLIHISTDYVFDGKAIIPYTENAETNPASVYGKSKLAGETAFMQSDCKGIIIRTSWLYSSYGNNFVKTIRKYAIEKRNLNIVYDQIGSPTYAEDLAKAILDILPSAINRAGKEVYHYSNEGVASWYDFGKSIADLSGIDCNILPVTTLEYPQIAVRPPYSVLNKSKIKEQFSLAVPYWRESLIKCLKKIK